MKNRTFQYSASVRCFWRFFWHILVFCSIASSNISQSPKPLLMAVMYIELFFSLLCGLLVTPIECCNFSCSAAGDTAAIAKDKISRAALLTLGHVPHAYCTYHQMQIMKMLCLTIYYGESPLYCPSPLFRHIKDV